MTLGSQQQLRGVHSSSIQQLEPTLWLKLMEFGPDEEFCLCWLQLQCRMIPNVNNSVVVVRQQGQNSFATLAYWPARIEGHKEFTPVIERVLAEEKGVAITPDRPSGTSSSFLAYPIKIRGEVRGVAAIEVSSNRTEELGKAMRQLQWGSAWLSDRFHRREVDSISTVKSRHALVLNMARLAIEGESALQASSVCLTQLAITLNCDRISLGFLNNNVIKFFNVSHSAQFGKEMNLIRAIEKAMEEAADQHHFILYPQTDETSPYINRNHQELSRAHGALSLLSSPFAGSSKEDRGVMTFEWSDPKSLDDEIIKICNEVANHVGPIIAQKKMADLPLHKGLARSLKKGALHLLGPTYMGLKAVCIFFVVALVFLGTLERENKIPAKAILEGKVQRAVVSPFEGYVAEATVRAGDVVQRGQVMVRLDDKDLSLERFRVLSHKSQLEFEYLQSMDSGKTTEARVIGEQIKQAEAQIWLLDEKLSRTELKAPIAGLVVSGDLSQALGSPVSLGQVLFEVAPLDAYRLVLEVDEKNIQEIDIGQYGQLVLNSLPEDIISFTVTKITPVALAKEGQNLFKVEAVLDSVSGRIRPGMEGYAKIHGKERSLLWIYTHDLIDWFRLKMWAWTR